MNNYPTWKPDADKAEHLLFDIGYSYALLDRAQKLLERLTGVMAAKGHLIGFEEANREGELFNEAVKLTEWLAEFKHNRLQVTTEIYDNVDGALSLSENQSTIEGTDPLKTQKVKREK